MVSLSQKFVLQLIFYCTCEGLLLLALLHFVQFSNAGVPKCSDLNSISAMLL